MDLDDIIDLLESNALDNEDDWREWVCKECLKSKLHAPNLHACIIYIRVNILPVCIFAHANANTHGS